MRYILALIMVVPLLMAGSLEADAGLVEDLRSGKSDVRAVSSTGNFTGVIRFWKQMKSQPDFKAIVDNQGWSHGAVGRHSAEAAIEGAIRNCEEEGGGRTKCQVYAVGDNIVQGRSQAELADAIEAYQLEVSGSKTTSKSRTSSHKAVYCKTNDGKVYVKYVYENSTGVCGGLNKKITQAEYDLKKTIYCKSVGFHNSYIGQKSDVTVYRMDGNAVVAGGVGLDCFYPHTQITKAEYDRLKDKNTDTTTSKTETESSNDDPLEAKLEKLKKLLEKDLITEEEAAAKRAKLLEDM